MYGLLVDGAIAAEFVAPLDLISNQPVSSEDGLSLQRVTTESPNQRWELTARLEPKSWDANDLYVHFAPKGRSSPYRIRVPQNTGVIAGTTSKSKLHTVTGTQFSSTLTLKDWTGDLPAGAMVTFNNHTKVYMLTKGLKTGSTSMSIYPKLRLAMTNVGFKYADDVEMDAWLDTDGVRGMRYTDGILMDLGSLKFVEKL